MGSENYPGIQSKAVDALIHAALAANTLDDLEAATRALDRVLINEYYLVPQYYNANSRIGYKTTLAYPKITPVTYQAEDWIIDYWYQKSQGALSAATPVSSTSTAN